MQVPKQQWMPYLPKSHCLLPQLLTLRISIDLAQHVTAAHMFRAQSKISKRNTKKGPDSANIYIYSYL